MIKTLFARSCNRCAFPQCDQRLTDPQWKGVRADIAHIHGDKPGAPRYVEAMTDEERNGVDNLILLCPNHHREIDRLEAEAWPAERLMKLKADHERACESRWATDDQLEMFAGQLIEGTPEATLRTSTRHEISAGLEGSGAVAATAGQDAPRGDTASGMTFPMQFPVAFGGADRSWSRLPSPLLTIERGDGETFNIVNVGEVDAHQVHMVAVKGVEDLILQANDWERIAPRSKVRGGIYGPSMASKGPAVIGLTWEDAGGGRHEGEFEIL